ncbi:MAG: hypothetical protein U1D67_09050 [Dehalococcoidia bacterium]|nr:hypothetical protein [Dehalococcoidia bacterium]
MDLQVLELMPGARALVRDYANTQPGEKVLIITDTSGFATPPVVQSIALASKEAGAEVVVITCHNFDPRVEEPPEVVTGAILNSDIVFDLGAHEATIHSRTGRIAVFEYGVKLINVTANTPELLASDWAKFPVELLAHIYRKVFEKVHSGKSIRVTSIGGTDITAGISPSHIMGFSRDEAGFPKYPSPKGVPLLSMWPMGVLGLVPQPPATGVIVFDALLGIKGRLKQPVKITVENNRFTGIHGGEEARWFLNLVQQKKREGIDSADYLVEIMWGLNPRASIERGLELIHLRESELTRRAGTIHFGCGGFGGGFHWDGIIITPFSVFIDGEAIIENGRVKALDLPETRQLAEKLGRPDKLLSEQL